MRKIKGVIFITSFLVSSSVLAWKNIGHSSVAFITLKLVNKKTETELKKILGLNLLDTLPQACNWPDTIWDTIFGKTQGVWHFVTVPNGKTYLNTPKNPKGDAIVKLIEYEDNLRKGYKNPGKKADNEEALRYICHLIADLHQPLHIGRPEDRGGNSIRLDFKYSTEKGPESVKTSLHNLWDDYLVGVLIGKLNHVMPCGKNLHKNCYWIPSLPKTPGEYAQNIKHNLDFSNKLAESLMAWDSNNKRWASGTYMTWADESQGLRAVTYEGSGVLLKMGQDVSNFNLDRYYKFHKNMLSQRILQAGVRLAFILDNIFSGKALSTAEKDMRSQVK
ncbi:MAG: hypothetical protein DRQ88_00095 [Epsilonproteobacteria bacterium]|nr:MAG: hypothetical protein DRQ89_10660 [Campylobacterota bacterium]RLA68037.1 MAG: hypothetical protein DRQ88_00095 [Campylobacterota bacterium]